MPNATGVNFSSAPLNTVENNTIAGNSSNGVLVSGDTTLNDGLVSHFPFDSSTQDALGANNPTATNAVTFGAGQTGNGISLGSGGYVEIADNSSLDNQQFSLEAWVSPVNAGSFDANGNAIIEKDLNSGSVGSVKIGWSPQTNKFGFGFGNYGTEYIFSTDTFAPGQFYHVVATYDGSTFSLYVNGTLEASRVLAKTITYDTAIPWTIGSNAGIFGYGRRWQGTIDAVGFFNRALSPAEVSARTNAGARSGAVIRGNSIGINATGTAIPNTGSGVRIEAGTRFTLIGGTTAADRNVISGNASFGVQITGAGSTGNTVAGNYIGTDSTGTLDRGNAIDGVRIEGSATNNIVGGAGCRRGQLD